MTISLAAVTPLFNSVGLDEVPDDEELESIDEGPEPGKLILLDGSVWIPKPASGTSWQNLLSAGLSKIVHEWLASTALSRMSRSGLAAAVPAPLVTLQIVR